jgi:hypothetical protein
MIPLDFKQRFLENTDHTGRQIVVSQRTGRQYYVEVLDSGNRTNWGDLNPATGKVEGKYGKKYRGCIDPKESMITEDVFEKVTTLLPGQSPYAYIDKIDAQYPDKQ